MAVWEAAMPSEQVEKAQHSHGASPASRRCPRGGQRAQSLRPAASNARSMPAGLAMWRHSRWRTSRIIALHRRLGQSQSRAQSSPAGPVGIPLGVTYRPIWYQWSHRSRCLGLVMVASNHLGWRPRMHSEGVPQQRTILPRAGCTCSSQRHTSPCPLEPS